MADVDRVIRDGKVTGWQARWRDPDGRQRKKTFPRRVDADRFLTQMRADMHRGAYIDSDAGRVLVPDYAATWIAGSPHRPSTAEHQARLLRNHITSTPLGRMRMSSVRASHVQAWASDRAKVLQPSTMRVVLQLVRSVFAAAVVDRVIGETPVQRITLPRHEPPRLVPLSVQQVATLADHVPDRCRAMVVAQAGLGLRVAELLGLTVADVYFLGRTVHVRHQLSRDTKRLEPCKTPRSVRAIPMPDVVGEALAAHMAAYPPLNGFLFTGVRGRPWWQMEYASRSSAGRSSLLAFRRGRRPTTSGTTTRASCSQPASPSSRLGNGSGTRTRRSS